jgi:hypothetical protein
VDAKRLFSQVYSLSEKDLEQKLSYMLLPFTDYLRDVHAHRHESVTLFEQYQKEKPPFVKDAVK